MKGPRCSARSGSVVLGLMAVGALLLAAKPYPDGPPPGHTGGFGEPTCSECHFDAPLNPDDAWFDIQVTDRDATGASLPDSVRMFVLRLTRPGLKRAGFQLTTRFADGRQAGQFEPLDPRVVADEDGVQYAIQTESGSYPVSPDTAEWRFRWIVPPGSEAVVVHAAANAGNGDDSPLGDAVVTRSMTLPPPR